MFALCPWKQLRSSTGKELGLGGGHAGVEQEKVGKGSESTDGAGAERVETRMEQVGTEIEQVWAGMGQVRVGMGQVERGRLGKYSVSNRTGVNLRFGSEPVTCPVNQSFNNILVKGTWCETQH